MLLNSGALLEHKFDDFSHLRHRTLLVNRTRGVPELVEGFLENINRVFHEPAKGGRLQ